MVYEPHEDSYLLEKHVKRLARGKALDMGSGTGILAKAALENTFDVTAVDIDEHSIALLKKIEGLKVVKSDLFEKVVGKFDTIIFNPPYLPNHPQIKDIALDGGKLGYEVIERFLRDSIRHLELDGTILILFSNLSNKKMVDFLIEKNLLEYEELARKKVGFFEELYVYSVSFSGLFDKLRDMGVTGLDYFTRGHRGILFRGLFRGDTVVIKTNLRESKAIDRMANERRYLQLLNKQGIGPKLIQGDDEFIMYRFIEGTFFPEFLGSGSKQEIDLILKEIFRQCFIMDKLMVNKEEMHHPVKHILVTPEKVVVLLDFERANHSIHPKNITQFIQFLISNLIYVRLGELGYRFDRDRLIGLSIRYRHKPDEDMYQDIVDYVIST